MTRRFEGRLIVVTGATAGIGAAASRAFVREGARVVAIARDASRLDALSQSCGGLPQLVPLRADVADGPSMRATAERVLREIGVPDVVVANAGRGMDARFVDTRDEDLRALFEVNVFGVFRTIRPFLPAMLARGSGRVLVISSVVGKRGVPFYSAYSASKFALHGMTEALQAELRGTGVSVGIVCPSSTATEFRDRSIQAGPSQPKVRVQTHTADAVAEGILRMAASRRREAVLSPEGKLMAWANKVAPSLVEAVLHRALVRKR